MDSRTHRIPLFISGLFITAAALLVAGCSTGMSSNTVAPGVTTSPAFVIGTDAPVASVVSFAVQLQSINAIDANGNSVPLLSGTPTVDFARFNGLQTLLDMNDVPVGTYSSVSITLGSATIGYLDTQTGGAPAIVTEAATLTSSTVNVTLASPLMVATTGPVGLRVDFDLRKSVQVDGTGAITGMVTPTFNVSAVGPSDAGGHIDTLEAAVVSVNTSGQSFVVQGPHGRQFTIIANAQTEWENNETISDLTSSSIVEISGTLDKADSTIDADDVAILSQNGFFASGQITYVKPASGAASSFDLYVRSLLPTSTGITLGNIATVSLAGTEKFFICWMHNPLTQFLFNSSTLLAGQRVSIGGPASGAANASAVTVKRVVLRNWGFNGTVVAGSEDPANGKFQITINGFAGLLVPQTVTVYGAPRTAFRDGLSGIVNLTDGARVRVVGLLLKDQTSGNTVLLAHDVDSLQ